MANEEQLSILKQGVEVWNEWRARNPDVSVNLSGANLKGADLRGANLKNADLSGATLSEARLGGSLLGERAQRTKLTSANRFENDPKNAEWVFGDFIRLTNLAGSSLSGADLRLADFSEAILTGVDFSGANLFRANLSGAHFGRTNFSNAEVSDTTFANSDLSEVIGLDTVVHRGPSSIATDVFVRSKGKTSEVFLHGCGLSDADIEYAKLSNPELSNEEINRILYTIYDFRANQPIQVSPLFISYSHSDGTFVDKVEIQLNKKGIRFWRDIHDLKAGRMEKQIDRAIRQNPTVLLVLSKHSLSSDWVEHEVRTARELEKEMGRDVLCPVALDDSWKDSRWPKRVMEQIMEYNILDFSEWKDESKFDGMFRRLIDGLGLFYKG
jgi:uncharacterized protein YjbI with pentapeptide repeats